MNVLITGGAGFVGSNLALTIKERWPSAEICCLDNLYRRGSELNLPRLSDAGIKFFKADVRRSDEFTPGPFEYLIECSAEPSVLAGQDGSPQYLFDTNLVGAFNCLEKARVWQSKVIFLSTSRVYPVAALEAHPWRETVTRFEWVDQGSGAISSAGVTEDLALTGARSLYGFTKLAAENLIEEYRAAFKLKAVINRCGVIAGPWQFGKSDQGVLALWVLAHHFGRPLSYIGYGGGGKQVRDFLHVGDLCALICEQMENFDNWDGWVGNVAGGRANSASLRELTDYCTEVTGRKMQVAVDEEQRPFDLRIFIGDCARLFAKTEWRPRASVRRIVEDTAAWVAEHERELASLQM